MKIEVNKETDTREPKAFIDEYGLLILPTACNSFNTIIGLDGRCREGAIKWAKLKDGGYKPLYEGDVITITL